MTQNSAPALVNMAQWVDSFHSASRSIVFFSQGARREQVLRLIPRLSEKGKEKPSAYGVREEAFLTQGPCCVICRDPQDSTRWICSVAGEDWPPHAFAPPRVPFGRALLWVCCPRTSESPPAVASSPCTEHQAPGLGLPADRALRGLLSDR